MPETPGSLEIRRNDDLTIIKFTERKILDEITITRIGEHLHTLVAKSPEPLFVLEFHNVTHMSSSALGMLITLLKRVREKGGQLRLAGIQPAILEVFRITRLNEVFDIYETTEEAMASIR
ncbi:MAG: STAS domain-containing protein [Phycisphaerae bacterium]